MQNFTSGMVLGIAFMLGIMLNKIDRIEKAVTTPPVKQTACKLT